MTKVKINDHSWIVEVLADLGKYAAGNKLTRLAVTMAETRRIASEEILVLNPPSNCEAVMLKIFPHIERKTQ